MGFVLSGAGFFQGVKDGIWRAQRVGATGLEKVDVTGGAGKSGQALCAKS